MVRVELAIEDIRPYLLADGGDVRIVSVNGSVLEIEFSRTCKDCSMAATTMKVSIEEVVHRRVREITQIAAVYVPEEEAVLN